jgi:hypothetical protein
LRAIRREGIEEAPAAFVELEDRVFRQQGLGASQLTIAGERLLTSRLVCWQCHRAEVAIGGSTIENSHIERVSVGRSRHGRLAQAIGVSLFQRYGVDTWADTPSEDQHADQDRSPTSNHTSTSCRRAANPDG